MAPRKTEILCVLALLLFTALVFLPAVSYEFAADDSSQVLSNPAVHSWRYVPSYFTINVWAHIKLAPGDRPAPYYRPAFLLWLLINYSLFGYRVWAWHAAVIVLHLFVTLLVYLLARRLSDRWPIAVMTALFFAVHPSHVEAVAWVSGVTEPLMAAPFLFSAWCYFKAADSRRKSPWMAASLILYAAALLAKETALLLPAVLVAYDLLLRPKDDQDIGKAGAILKRMSGYACVAAGYWVLRSMALHQIRAFDYSWSTLLYTWPSVVWFYISHLLWPAPLSFFYNLKPILEFAAGPVLAPLVLVTAALGALGVLARNRLIAFAALWGVLTILPPLYLRAFIPYELVHDRYLYLPSIGFCILLAIAVGAFPGRFGASRLMALAAATCLALVYAGATVYQSRYWSSELSLFTHAFLVGNQNWFAERNYAFALGRSGHCGEAAPKLAVLVDREPADVKANFALGSCYFHLGDWDAAERIMRRTAELSPHYQQPHLVLAAIKLGQGHIADAEQAWSAAVRAQDGIEELSLHYVRGEILKAEGDLRGAAEEFRKELLVQPGNPEILSQLASVGGS